MVIFAIALPLIG